MRERIVVPFVVAFVTLFVSSAGSQVVRESDPELDRIDVIEKLGDTIPLSLPVVTETGDTVLLSSFFESGRPVILTMAYYRCPMLCNLVLNGLADAVKDAELVPGKEYQMLTMSINPAETSELAAAKKANYLGTIGWPADDPAWHFLTGPESSSKALADAVGFSYFYDEERKEYAHPAVVMLLSPEGKVTRYLYGIQHASKDLRLAVVEASEGKVGSTIDKLILYCFHYDPAARGYVLAATNMMKIGGMFMVVLVVGLVVGLRSWERRRDNNRAVVYIHRPYIKVKKD